MKDSGFQGLVQGVKEAQAFARGAPVEGMRACIPDEIDVASVGRKTALSQAEFSSRIGISTATLRHWEQGRRKPEGPARVLLLLIDANPKVVEQTLRRT